MSCSATTSMTVSLTTRNELDADGTGDEVQSAPARVEPDERHVPGGVDAAEAAPGPVRRLGPPARSGVGGAAWLALAVLDPALATRDAHARLCA